MADDLGWGDLGFNGNSTIHTPHLDRMSSAGITFDRFYAAAPVCSPTRGSCLTGRHPYRYNIRGANSGHLLEDEISIAEILKEAGYRTGFFGKWHLGTLTTSVVDSNRGRPGATTHFSPPSLHGFDQYFATEAKVPTWNPMIKPGTKDEFYGTRYWTTSGEVTEENLSGDDSRVIMDRVVPFIRAAVQAQENFLAVVWFHSPHLPCVGDNPFSDMYRGNAYFGCITAMDTQMGRLREELQSLGVEEDTMIWFCSDNGPEGRSFDEQNGSAGPFRGRKRSLYEGGVRVPAVLHWPRRIPAGQRLKAACSTSDFLPTLVDYLDLRLPDRPLDGISLRPLFEGLRTDRKFAIGFWAGKQKAWTTDRFKLYSNDNGSTYALYDLQANPNESVDLSEEFPEVKKELIEDLQHWAQSCSRSQQGLDYR